MASWESNYVEADGLRLHYTRTGDGTKPPVVLAHGFSDDGPCWTALAEALESDYDVVMTDARGHGKSDAPENGYGQMEMARDLKDVIEALGLKRPAILGHSMGGATTMVFAGTYPDIPRAILIEDAGAFNLGTTARTPEQEERWNRMRNWVMRLKRTTKDELIQEQRAQTPHWDDAEIDTWADSKLRLSPNVINRANVPPTDWPSILPRIACPALLMIADTERGGMVSPDGAKELQAMIPGLRIAHIPDAGHCIRRDQGDAYLKVVRDFLQETREPA